MRALRCDRVALMLTLDELRSDIETGAVDTVIAAFTDMQGRLMGKRLDAEFFLEELDAGHEVEGCNYLLALEMEMDPVPGYAIASWERGYGDFGLQPDLGSLRRIPWHEATALVLCDVQWHDGSPVAASPRQVLKAQLEKAAALGYEAMFGSELEFFLFRESYEEAHAKHFRDLTPSVPYILDYHILASGYDEPFMRAVRTAMRPAGRRRRLHGRTTTARAATGSSGAARRSVLRRASPEPTPTRTSRLRRSSPPACTGSSRSSSSGPRSRAMRTSPTSSASRTRC